MSYGERRQIQRAMVGGMEVSAGKEMVMNGGMVFDGQDAVLKMILKSITKPDGTKVEGDLFAEIMGWTDAADGDAVYEVVNEAMDPNAKKRGKKNK